ncbi:MAG TPA: hypothetical protein VLC95_18160, partial [Anaerolineae bacterium]|nr:hypothetical protein [Anaerolineae bacterium]
MLTKMGSRLSVVTVFIMVLSLVLSACGATAEPAPTQPAPEPTTVVEPTTVAESTVPPEATTAAEPTTATEATTAPEPPASEYNEAPMLAELVAAGELPPVDERLPEEPLVEEVV